MSNERRRFLALSSALALGALLPGTVYARVIRDMAGPVWINDQAATPDTEIRRGDSVRTGEGGAITFVIGEDAHRLGPNSELRVDWAESGATAFLRMVTGTLASSFGKGQKQVVLPSATLGIRGTATFLKVDAEQTYFCTCYGNTSFHTHDGQQRTISAPHHFAYTIGHADRVDLAAADMLYHNDEDIIALDQIAGRKSPETFK